MIDKKTIKISTEFITLGSFLKYTGIVSQGSDVKFFLQKNKILIDNVQDNRRGRKIYPNSTISINGELFLITGNIKNE